jgi:hypothetical protein
MLSSTVDTDDAPSPSTPSKKKRDEMFMQSIIGVGAIAAAGTVNSAQLEQARTLLSSIPKSIMSAVHNPLGAQAIILSMLLDSDVSTHTRQLQAIEASPTKGLAEEIALRSKDVAELPPEASIPLIDAAMPALRQMSRSQWEQFRAVVTACIEADGEVDLFEWMVVRVVLRRLSITFGDTKRPRPTIYAIGGPLKAPLRTMLSVMARVGSDDGAGVELAYRTGTTALPLDLGDLLPEDQCSLDALDTALNTLATVGPKIKQPVLEAAIATVAADHTVTLKESELLRSLCATLDVPMGI